MEPREVEQELEAWYAADAVAWADLTGFTEQELTFLRRAYEGSWTYLRLVQFQSLTDAEREHYWRSWVYAVRKLEVRVFPGQRALVWRPGSLTRVEVRWGRDRRYGQVFKSMTITGSHGIDASNVPNDAAEHLAALTLTLARQRKSRGRLPTTRPEAGAPRNTAFYRQLLAKYDRLVAEGRPDPLREIARQMDAPVGTVKSWLHRGRKYLNEKG